MSSKLSSLGLVLILFMAADSNASVRLPKIFGDNMVLEQKSKVPVWGWADPNEQITVQCGWSKKQTKTIADAQGKWSARVVTPEAGGPYEVSITGKSTITFRNVLVGEVWICSGQSNMEMPMVGYNYGNQRVEDANNAIKNANYPNIRLFTVEHNWGTESLTDCNGQWQPCSPDTVKSFSAVAYFFGRELYKNLNVPIGLMNISWGGTGAEAWTGKQAYDNHPELKVLIEEFNKVDAEYKTAVAKAKAESKPIPEHPQAPNHAPTYLFNGMIAPVIPFTIKGVIWYQGEGDAPRAYLYRKQLPALIENWRSNWGIGDFPFYIVQLTSLGRHEPGTVVTIKKGEPADDAWAELREAQLITMRNVKNTGMAVTIDIGSTNAAHAPKKLQVGQRLAYWALAKDYGKKLHYCSPIYKDMKIEDGKIRVAFEYLESGLKAGSDTLDGFAIAGSDRKFVWADARIDGRTVVVWSDKIASPVAVRYAWAQYPFCNLFDNEGLPASPFRTDDWPMITKK
jgi:sialate O-acetylesterase